MLFQIIPRRGFALEIYILYILLKNYIFYILFSICFNNVCKRNDAKKQIYFQIKIRFDFFLYATKFFDKRAQELNQTGTRTFTEIRNATHIARVTLQYITVDIDDNINIISNLISEH